eukprot:3254367-Rhodomonas_salina.1
MVEAVLEQHWRGDFSTEREVAVGLRFVKEHLQSYIGEKPPVTSQAGAVTSQRGARGRGPLYIRGVEGDQASMAEVLSAVLYSVLRMSYAMSGTGATHAYLCQIPYWCPVLVRDAICGTRTAHVL